MLAVKRCQVRAAPCVKHSAGAAPLGSGYRCGSRISTIDQGHMESKTVISFDYGQVAAALEDAGFEASEGNVTAIVDYIKDGGEGVENFAAAFRTLIADVAMELKLRQSASARINAIREQE
jgi:hypothetical protein